MAMLKVWISDSFTSHKAHYYAAYNTEFSSIVRSYNLLIHLTECYDMVSRTFEDHLKVIRVSSIVRNINMADMRFCEPLSTQTSPTLGIINDDYVAWNKMHCV